MRSFWARFCSLGRGSTTSRAFTLFLVPHSGSKSKRFRLPAWTLKATIVLLLIFVGGLSWFSHDYLRLRAHQQELARLRIENQRQAQQIKALGEEAVEVQERLLEVDQLDAEVRALVGLPERSEQPLSRGRPALPQGGPGRSLTPERIRSAFRAATDSIDPYKENLLQLKTEVEEEQRRLAHVPAGRPVQGTLSSGFGARRSPYGWSTEFHEGVDICAPYGTAIRATGAGTVTFSGWKGGYGQMLIIDHGYGYQTAYAHNSKHNVSLGAEVQRGDVIAYVGSSGRSTGPHVHYEVIYLGAKKNPAHYF